MLVLCRCGVLSFSITQKYGSPFVSKQTYLFQQSCMHCNYTYCSSLFQETVPQKIFKMKFWLWVASNFNGEFYFIQIIALCSYPCSVVVFLLYDPKIVSLIRSSSDEGACNFAHSQYKRRNSNMAAKTFNSIFLIKKKNCFTSFVMSLDAMFEFRRLWSYTLPRPPDSMMSEKAW